MSKITFNPRWKEELLASSNEGVLIFELTMGQLHVYFPDAEQWKKVVPAWAGEKWEVYVQACTDWCKENKIPISITHDAYVYEEKT
ncbi:MAG: hypothetical protein WDO16_14165 [Bacteroidota bacterium]